MLTTLQQAKKLKELGCKLLTHAYYSFDEKLRFHTGIYDWNTHASKDTYAVPSVAEALEWFREVKGIECAVNLYQDDAIEDCIYYVGCYKYCDVIRPIGMKLTHSEAESALLDVLIEYELSKLK